MPRRPTPAQIAALPREQYLRRKLTEIEEDLVTARKAAAHTAIHQLHGRSLAARAELEEFLAASAPAPEVAADPTAGLSDAEVASHLAEALRALPVTLMDDVLDLVGADRRETGHLRVLDGGSAS